MNDVYNNLFKKPGTDTSKFTRLTEVFSSGGPDKPVPIGLTLLPIDEVFSNSFFRALDQQSRCTNLAQRKKNVKLLLKVYPNLKGASNPHHGMSSDLDVKEIERVIIYSLMQA